MQDTSGEHSPHARLEIEVDLEDDGRWIAEVAALSGALAYGLTRNVAIQRVQVLSLRLLADAIEHGEQTTAIGNLFAVRN